MEKIGLIASAEKVQAASLSLHLTYETQAQMSCRIRAVGGMSSVCVEIGQEIFSKVITNLRRAVFSYWLKEVHLVLVNCLG